VARYRAKLLNPAFGQVETKCLGKTVKLGEWTEWSDEELEARYKRPGFQTIRSMLGEKQYLVQEWSEDKNDWADISYWTRDQLELVKEALAEADKLARERDERVAVRKVKDLEKEIAQVQAERDAAQQRLSTVEERLAEATAKLGELEHTNI
jgi:vacuolar-type H+-ATPase subunit I/STV1